MLSESEYNLKQDTNLNIKNLVGLNSVFDPFLDILQKYIDNSDKLNYLLDITFKDIIRKVPH